MNDEFTWADHRENFFMMPDGTIWDDRMIYRTLQQAVAERRKPPGHVPVSMHLMCVLLDRFNKQTETIRYLQERVDKLESRVMGFDI